MKDLGQGWREHLANRGLDNNFGGGAFLEKQRFFRAAKGWVDV